MPSGPLLLLALRSRAAVVSENRAKCVPPGGPVQVTLLRCGKCRVYPVGARACATKSMRENVDVVPAGEVEFGAGGEEFEARPGQPGAVLAFEHAVERGLQLVEIGDVVGGIGELPLAQVRRTPVRALLLLGEVDAEEFLHQVLETVFVRIRPNQLGGDLGAIDGRGQHAEIAAEHRHVEARVVEQLGHAGVGQEPVEIGCRVRTGRKLHGVAHAVAGRELHQAQPVAERIETQRLAVDGDKRSEVEIVGQVALVQLDLHVRASTRSARASLQNKNRTGMERISAVSKAKRGPTRSARAPIANTASAKSRLPPSEISEAIVARWASLNALCWSAACATTVGP